MFGIHTATYTHHTYCTTLRCNVNSLPVLLTALSGLTCVVLYSSAATEDCMELNAFEACLNFSGFIGGYRWRTVQVLQIAELNLHTCRFKTETETDRNCTFCTPLVKTKMRSGISTTTKVTLFAYKTYICTVFWRSKYLMIQKSYSFT